MIWRQSYESSVTYDESLPVLQLTTLSGENLECPDVYVLLVGRAFDALVEQNVWWKLHTEDFSQFKHVYRVFANLTPTGVGEVESMIAPSHRARTLVAQGDIDEMLDPTKPSQCFAGIVSGAKFTMAVRGLPTEDCWEEFANRLRSELDRSSGRQDL